MKKKILNNLGVKLLSLLIAIIVWLVIVNLDDPTKTVTIRGIPITIINDEALSDVGQCYQIVSEEQISITIEGKKTIVDRLSSSDFEAVADIEKMSITNSVPVTVNALDNLASQVTITDGKTNNIVVELDNYITKSFDLMVEKTGFVTTDYYIGDNEIAVSSKKIKISGPEKLIKIIDKVVVVVDISDITEETSFVANIKTYDNNGSEVTSNRLTYNRNSVNITIKPLLVKKLSIKSETEGDVDSNYILKGTTVSVNTIEIAGDSSAIAAAKNIVIKTDISDISENLSKEYNIADYIPSNVKLISENEKVTVKVDIDPLEIKVFSFSANELKFVNVQNDVFTNYDSDAKLSVRVRGEKDVIDDVTIESLSPHVDVSKLKSGTQTVEILVNEIEGVDVLMKSSIKIEMVDKNTIVDEVTPTSTPTPTPSVNSEE